MKISIEVLSYFITIFTVMVVTFIGVVFFPEKIMIYFFWAMIIFFVISIVIFLSSLVADKIMEGGV